MKGMEQKNKANKMKTNKQNFEKRDYQKKKHATPKRRSSTVTKVEIISGGFNSFFRNLRAYATRQLDYTHFHFLSNAVIHAL